MRMSTTLPQDDLNDVPAIARAAEAAGYDGLVTSENRNDPYLPLGVAAGVENVDVLMLGPLAVLGCAAAVASGAALLAACSGHAAASWVLDAIAVGGFVAGWRVVGCR